MRLPTLTHLDLNWTTDFLISELITFNENNQLSSLSHKAIQLEVFDTMLTSQVARLVNSKFSDGRPVLDLALLKKLHGAVDWSDQGADKIGEVLSSTTHRYQHYIYRHLCPSHRVGKNDHTNFTNIVTITSCHFADRSEYR